MKNGGVQAGLLALFVLPAALQAQGDCYPGADSHEAKVFATFSVPLTFSPLAAPDTAGPRWRATLEVSSLPNIDTVTATPTICRPGKGPENTDLLFAMVRPRIAVRLGGGFTVDASWIPPIPVNGVKTNIFGLALGWAREMSPKATFGARVHGTFGYLNAPITCPADALDDPDSECLGGTESDDHYAPNIFGADLSFGFGAATAKLRPYVGGGYSRLMPRFQVNFTNSQGETDNRKVFVDMNRLTVFGGASWRLGSFWGLAGEIFSAPADAVTARLGISGRF